MAGLEYSARTSLIGGDLHLQLIDGGMTIVSGSSVNTIPYSDVRTLRLITFAGAGGRQGRAIISTVNDGEIKFGSHHFVSLGNFEDRSVSYVPFIRELSKKIRIANPQAGFMVGSVGLWLAWLFVVLLVLGVCVLLAAIALEASAPWVRLIGVAALVLLAGPYSVWWAMRSRPQSFDPKSIPADVII